MLWGAGSCLPAHGSTTPGAEKAAAAIATCCFIFFTCHRCSSPGEIWLSGCHLQRGVIFHLQGVGENVIKQMEKEMSQGKD